MIFRWRTLFFFALGSLALFGFGCREPRLYTIGNINSGQIVIPAKEAPEEVSAAPYNAAQESSITIVRKAFTNMSQVKSFRALMTFPSPGEIGTVVGEMVFDRKKGTYGILRAPGETSSEIFVNEQTVYYRSNTSTWQDLSTAPDGTKISHMLSGAISFEENLDALYAQTTRIIEVRDDVSGCQMYTFATKPSTDISEMFITTCIKDGYPTYISTQLADGPFEIRYRDINKPVTVYPPIIKK